jgi:acylphosphatase
MATPVFRLEAYFSGRVQGVGFRYTARQIAQGYAVTGRVSNLPDGRVHLVAEGAEAEVRGYLAEVHEHLGHFIKETVPQTLEGPPQYRDFHIG